jgi:hypothetical protein
LTFTFRCCLCFTYLELTAQLLPPNFPPLACVLTFVFRADRWLHTFNDPLVHVLSEYESSLNELATAQELRVTAANEVLASMKIIAGSFSFCHAPRRIHHVFACAESSRAGRDAFLSVRGQVQGANMFQCLRLFTCLWLSDISCAIV